MDPAATQDEKQSPLAAGVIGSLLGLVVMFFPPHFLTMFFAPWIGGGLAGMRAHARGTDALVIGPVVGSVCAGIAGVGAALMAVASARGDQAGVGGWLSQVENPAIVVLGLAAMWTYCTVAGAAAAMVGGWLKRIG